jgi:hypothetical protein
MAMNLLDAIYLAAALALIAAALIYYLRGDQ